MFFWSKVDQDLIWWWPQRILTYYSIITYAAGILAPVVLFSWAQKHVKSLRFGFNNGIQATTWILVAAFTVWLVFSESSLFQFSRVIERVYADTKKSLLDSGMTNTQLTFSGLNVKPFGLRCVPYILFSDPDVIQRKILICTDWHAEPRHPMRINPWNDLAKLEMYFVFPPIPTNATQSSTLVIPGDRPQIFQPPAAAR
jgi:hypothetical protein